MNTTLSRPSVWELLDRQMATQSTLSWNPARTPVLAIVSEKGGVGKTGLAGGVVAVAAAAGLKVLAIDLDPRATLTAELDAEEAEFSVNDLLYVDRGEKPVNARGLAADAIVSAGEQWPGVVHVLAAERALSHRESDTETPNLENRLRLSLMGVAENYDLVVIDVPPRAGGKLVMAALYAATQVLLAATLDEDGYIGVRDAVTTIEYAQASTEQQLRIAGVVRNIVDRRRTTLAGGVDDKLAEEFGPLLLDAAVPKYVIRQEARTARVPITVAPGPEARALIGAYTLVLNRVSAVEE